VHGESRRAGWAVRRLERVCRYAFPPQELPFRFDPATIARGLNFTLSTALGDLDLLGKATGAGTYENLLPDTVVGVLDGVEFRCVSLRRLILLKRAAGRPKDLNIVRELEALLEEQSRGTS